MKTSTHIIRHSSVTTIAVVIISGLLLSTTAPAQSPTIDWNKVDIGTMDAQVQTEMFRTSRESLASDSYRPLYHFSSPGAGIHDPAGLCYWQGRYHLFFLHNGWRARGHAVSDDLVHWRDLPVAIVADQAYEADGRFLTGQVMVTKDQAVMSYCPVGEGICIATASDPLLLDWKKHPANPVISRPTDSSIFGDGDQYYLLLRNHTFKLGLRWLSGKTTLELLRSRNLGIWEPLGNLLEDEYYTEPGDDGACPNFLPIGNDRHMLLFFSHKRSAMYYIGTYDRENHRFIPESHGRMNYGPVKRGSLHAPTAFVDQQGRYIGMFNIIENRRHKGWSEIMSLPRHFSLDEKNSLRIEPVEELRSLRFDPVTVENVTIPANSEKVLAGIEGKAMEIELEFDPMNAREIGLNVLRSPDAEEQTSITLYMHGTPRSPGMRELAIDVSSASLDAMVDSRSPEIGPLYLEDGDLLRLRIFIDRSVIEVFANGRQCLTLGTYPSREDSKSVSVFARGKDAKLVSLRAYQMRSIWPDLKYKEGQ